MTRGIVYLYTSPSGKHYVGQTINEKRRRKLWFSNSYHYAGDKIDRARNKYGKENFQYDILYSRIFNNKQQAIEALNTAEFFYTNLYDAVNNGYNCRNGGKANWEDKTAHTCNKGGYRLSEITKTLIGKASKERWKSPEGRLKMLQGRIGVKKKRGYRVQKTYIPVVQLSKKGEYIQAFPSVTDAILSFPKAQNVSAVCRGLRMTAGGYMWVYKEDYEKYFLHPEEDMPQRVKSKLNYIAQLNKPKQQVVEKKERYKYTEEDKRRMTESRKKTNRGSGKFIKVGQYGEDLKLIKVWSCAGEAAEALGYNQSNIFRACKILGMYKGYYWRVFDGQSTIHKKSKSPKDVSYMCKKVIQKDDNNNILAVFNRITEAARSIGINYNTCISKCLASQIPHAHGFVWEYYKQ